MATSFSALLPGYEGSYDANLEAVADGPVVTLTLITHNPNYGGASGLGTWTLHTLEVADPRCHFAGYQDVFVDLVEWVRALTAAAKPPYSPAATRVLNEPVEGALAALVEALRAADRDSLRVAYRLAPCAIDALVGGVINAAVHGHSPLADAVARLGHAEAMLARWRAQNPISAGPSRGSRTAI